MAKPIKKARNASTGQFVPMEEAKANPAGTTVETIKKGSKPKEFISVFDLPKGAHFWAKLDDKIVVINKTEDGCYVAGAWECAINMLEIEVLEVIPMPNGYKVEDLYYGL